MAPLELTSRIKLRDGNEIPVLGFGTYELEGEKAYDAVKWALEAGYRLIDSAEWYENEKEVGSAILDFCKKTGIPRSAIFYISKLKYNNGYENVSKAISRSVQECGLDYIDLYLIHGPLGGPEARKDSWRAIADAQKQGLLRSIGISTFGIRHMNDILSLDIGVPVVHQIDLHPFMTRTEIVKFSKEHGMILQAWAPLVRSMRFDHPEIVKLSNRYSKQPSHILLRYLLDKEYIPIPKSGSRERIISNASVFDFSLSPEEVATLDGLNENLVTDWEPTDCE